MSSKNNSLLNFINHQFDGKNIKQNENDGYLCATDMCKIGNKLFADWYRLDTSKEFINELSSYMNYPIDQLIHKKVTGINEHRGTYVHPRVAIYIAQWISPKFAVRVTDWVYRYLSGDMTLAAEIVSNYDNINNTTSTVIVNTIEKKMKDFVGFLLEIFELIPRTTSG